MLPSDNVSMSVGHLDQVLIVYSSMEHVIWKSPGPMCGWVGRILHPDSCTSVSFWSKVHIPLPWRLGYVYQLWKSPVLSCVPWSSDRTYCLSLQHLSWSSSCKGHGRSIRSSLHPWPCPSDEPQSSPRVFPVSACKVRSFYVIDYTNWMHLFNAVVKLLWKILTFIFAVLLPFWSKLTTWSCNLRPCYIPVVSNSLRAWAGQLVGRCYPSTGRPTVPIYIGLPVYRISTS